MPPPIETVLVGTTLSGASDDVVRAGLAVARAVGARVHLVHAFMLPLAYADGPYVRGWHAAEMTDTLGRELETGLAKQVERLGITSTELGGTTLELGTPRNVLLDVATESTNPLIVVGAADARDRVSRILGSTAEHVIRHAVDPVLVVRGTLSVPPERVLAPVDLKPLTADALERGLRIIAALTDERDPPSVRGLFVLDADQRWIGPPFDATQAERFVSRELARYLRDVPSPAGQTVDPLLRTGRPAAEIIAEAERWPADLVLIGTHGESMLERALLGSVAARVVRGAPCSVLVLPPAEEVTLPRST